MGVKIRSVCLLFRKKLCVIHKSLHCTIMMSSHVLEGSSGGVGGLIIRKTKKESDDTNFKVPSAPQKRGSILGLDKLAQLKRKIREDEENAKKSSNRNDSSSSSSSEDEHDDDGRPKPKKDRKYRSKYDETPTYTGGVNRQAQEKIIAKERNYKDKYVH